MSAITATPKSVRPHVMVARIEEEEGGRWWSEPMSKLELDLWLDKTLVWGRSLDDYCCSAQCWCVED